MVRNLVLAAAATIGLVAASSTPAAAWHHGHGWGYGGYTNPVWGVGIHVGHGWGWGSGWYRPAYYTYAGPRYWTYGYQPVVFSGPRYIAQDCHLERRVRYSSRQRAYIVRHVRVCF